MGKDRESKTKHGESRRGTSPTQIILGAGVLGGLLLLGQVYRMTRGRKRPRWKSQSRHPQIAQWESEGGKVPQVSSLKRHTRH